MACKENDGDLQSDLGHAFLQIEPAQTRQLQVQHQTTWRLGAGAGQELLRGREGFDLQAGRPNQTTQPLPNRGVVVHNGDDCVRLPRLSHAILLRGISEE